MTRFSSLAACALVAGSLMLFAPSDSRADNHRHWHGGYRGHGHIHRGYDRFDWGHRHHGNYYGGWYGGYSRPAVVHPETLHWTPYRGWHTHGHLHVPHRGHYHTIPY